MSRAIWCVAAVSLCVALGLAGCADEGTDEPAAPTTVTVTTAVSTVVPPPPTVTESPDVEGQGEIVVPNVIGKNHQSAQDTMQDAGLFNLSEEDATGQGRLLLWDRNWVVVSQSPAPGTRVREDATITLRSKKYSD